MSTPKEKLAKSQTLNAKKKKFFKVLQSSDNGGSSYCATLSDRLRGELDAQIKAIFETEKRRLAAEAKVLEEPVAVEGKDAAREQRKRQKLLDRKATKFADLVCGLNQTLKLIKSQHVCMVWIDHSLAANLVNILHKLCTINQVFCLDLDLASLKLLANVSTLSVVALRTNVQQQAESPFHSIYQFLVTSVFKSIKVEPDCVKSETTGCCKAEATVNQTPAEDKPVLLSASVNYYLDNDSDPYCEVMRKRLLKSSPNESIAKNEFEQQRSFISISHPEHHDPYFPDYANSVTNNIQMLEITIEQKQSKAQAALSANRLTEKLFDIDKLNSSISSGSKTPPQFKSPKLVKGQVAVEQSGTKRKRSTNKAKNKAQTKQMRK